MRKYVLVVAYYSFKDPVFKSAVLPYFIGLSEKTSMRFILLTFEQKKFKLTESEKRETEQMLAKEAIIWYRLNWHSGAFKLVKKVFDSFAALCVTIYIAVRYSIKAVYSEGFPGAVIGHYLAKLMDRPHFVHTFEPHTDYMVESGVWSESSMETKVLKRLEMTVAKNAQVLMTATDAYIKKMEPYAQQAQFYRIPSCVDIQLFKFDETERIAVRARLNVKENDCLIVYLGKLGGMYMDTEMVDFFGHCYQHSKKVKFKFLVLTPDDQKKTESLFHEKIPSDHVMVRFVHREDVYRYLSASDFGFVGVKQKPSKRFCSPIKDGEYWSCGLPILIPEGISDDYIFAAENGLGIVIKDSTRESFEAVLAKLESWHLTEDKADVRKRCRNFVEQDRSIDRYQDLYSSLFNQYIM